VKEKQRLLDTSVVTTATLSLSAAPRQLKRCFTPTKNKATCLFFIFSHIADYFPNMTKYLGTYT
jgi:hypothetical protein